MRQQWKKVRVFISSTFQDMRAERDHLVLVVFPELKKLCREKQVQLTDVDLRWGVSESDAQDGKALDICLNEIDSCRPYFLGLLGHRYGSVPPGERRSITAAEIYHGVLHNDLPKQVVDLRGIIEGRLEGLRLSNKQINCLRACYPWDGEKRKYILRGDLSKDEANIIRGVFSAYATYQRDRSFFFFRTERLSRELAGGNQADFFESGQDKRNLLDGMQQEIKGQGLWWTDYDRIEPKDENDLEAFGRQVKDVLWKHIQAELAEESPEAARDPLDAERELHDIFAADRTWRFVGRRSCLDQMHSFCEETGRVLVVTGEPGSGKSALMARFAEEIAHAHPDWLVIPHFVGASPDSTNLRRTLRRFFGEINRRLGLNEEIPEDIRDLATRFPDKLSQAANSCQVLFILDAMNQMERADTPQDMTWLPANLPENVRWVVSSLAGEALDALQARKPGMLMVRGLDADETELLVDEYLAEVRKEKFPTPRLRAAFLAKVSQGSPLYTMVALEELRVFGAYDKLGGRIDDLPGDVPALFQQVLARVERDFAAWPGLVAEALSLIACGRQGMTNEELQDLLAHHAPPLSDGSPASKLPDMIMARLRLSLDAYLFERAGAVDFFHGQLKEAVGARYLSQEADRDRWHQTIADYFEPRWAEPYVRALDELPHHLVKAKDWDGVERVLCDLSFVEGKCANGMVYDLIRDYHPAMKYRSPSNLNLSDKHIDTPMQFQAKANVHAVSNRLSSIYRFVQSQAQLLFEYSCIPGFVIQQAAIFGIDIFNSDSENNNLSETEDLYFMRGRTDTVLNDEATITKFVGEEEAVSCLAVSPHGDLIAVGYDNGYISIYDSLTTKLLNRIKNHENIIRTLIFSLDGKTMLSIDDKNKIVRWNVSPFVAISEKYFLEINIFNSNPDCKGVWCSDDKGAVGFINIETMTCINNNLTTVQGDPIGAYGDPKDAVIFSEDKAHNIWCKFNEKTTKLTSHQNQIDIALFVFCIVAPFIFTLVGHGYLPGHGIANTVLLVIWIVSIGLSGIYIWFVGYIAWDEIASEILCNNRFNIFKLFWPVYKSLVGMFHEILNSAFSSDQQSTVVWASSDRSHAIVVTKYNGFRSRVRIKYWDINQGRCLNKTEFWGDEYYFIGVSADGNKSLVGSDDALIICIPRSGLIQSQHNFSSSAFRKAISISADGYWTAVSYDNQVELIDNSKFKPAFKMNIVGKRLRKLFLYYVNKLAESDSGLFRYIVYWFPFYLAKTTNPHRLQWDNIIISNNHRNAVSSINYGELAGLIAPGEPRYSLCLLSLGSEIKFKYFGHREYYKDFFDYEYYILSRCACFSPDDSTIIYSKVINCHKLIFSGDPPVDRSHRSKSSELVFHNCNRNKVFFRFPLDELIAGDIPNDIDKIKCQVRGDGAQVLISVENSSDTVKHCIVNLTQPDSTMLDPGNYLNKYAIYSPDGHIVWLDKINKILTMSLNGLIAMSSNGRIIVRNCLEANNICVFNVKSDNVKQAFFTPDNTKLLLHISKGKMGIVEAWDINTCSMISAFYLPEGIVNMAACLTNLKVLLFTAKDGVVFMRANKLCRAPMTTTATRTYHYNTGLRFPFFKRWDQKSIWFNKKRTIGRWSQFITAVCPGCGKRHIVSQSILDAINALCSHLAQDQSPFRNISSEAWEDPHLLSKCPACKLPLKFNPFVVDNRDLH